MKFTNYLNRANMRQFSSSMLIAGSTAVFISLLVAMVITDQKVQFVKKSLCDLNVAFTPSAIRAAAQKCNEQNQDVLSLSRVNNILKSYQDQHQTLSSRSEMMLLEEFQEARMKIHINHYPILWKSFINIVPWMLLGATGVSGFITFMEAESNQELADY